MWSLCENKRGVVIYNWHGKVKFGLPLDIGDIVEILEENGDWFRGKCTKNPKIIGLFPKSYIHLKDTTKLNAVFEETTETLHDWYDIWKQSYVKNDNRKFLGLQTIMLSVLEHSKNFRDEDILSRHYLRKIEKKIIPTIDWGNQKLGLDLVPRDELVLVDQENIGILGLHEAHIKSTENSIETFSGETLNKTEENENLNHHLYMCVRKIVNCMSDDYELYFSLYNADPQINSTLTERFSFNLFKNEIFDCTEKCNSTIFTDLGSNDLNEHLYIVINIIKVGKIFETDKATTGKCFFRRPFGSGVINLHELIKIDQNKDESNQSKDENTINCCIKLFQCDEKDFGQLHEFIIKKEIGKFTIITPSQGISEICLTMKLLHGNLKGIKSLARDFFDGIVITKKIGYPDFLTPKYERNDIFITLDCGQFEMGRKSTQMNLQINVYLLDSNGEKITNCLWSSSSNRLYDESYGSIIFYHNNSPNWNETIRLSIPIDIISDVHILFKIRHYSTHDNKKSKVYGCSFIRLINKNGTIIKNGLHELFVYKYSTTLKKNSSLDYLKLPYYSFDDQAKQHTNSLFSCNSKEYFKVKTVVCSTKLIQNNDLMIILKWKTNTTLLTDALNNLQTLNPDEFIRNLEQILKALLKMFSTFGKNSDILGRIFTLFVTIFSLLQTNKYKSFNSVANEFIENKFTTGQVHKQLLSLIKFRAQFCATADNPEQFLKCFESLESIFKIIIKSKNLDPATNRKEFNELFEKNLRSVLNLFYEILKKPTNEKLITIQDTLLRSVGVIFEQIHDNLPVQELAEYVVNFLSSVPEDGSVQLVKAKLQAFKDLTLGFLFYNDESRNIILPFIFKQLRFHMLRRDEIKLCANILTEILLQLYKYKKEKQTETIVNDLNIICKNILEIIIEIIQKSKTYYECVLTPLVTIILGLLQELNETNYNYLWDEMKIGKVIKCFLFKILTILKELVTLNWNLYPNEWLIMKLAANKILLKSFVEFKKPLIQRFSESTTFDYQLWRLYFNFAVSYLNQPCLQLEKYKEKKCDKIQKIYGDMRILMGYEIVNLWSELGENKIHFIPSLIEPLLEVTLISQLALRKATLNIFYDMMQCEHSSFGSLKKVQNELIHKIDVFINQNKGDHEYLELFNSILLEKVYKENPKWKDESAEFITSMTLLIQILLDHRCVLKDSHNNCEKLMACEYNLINFYKNDVRGKDKHLRHIYKLYELNLQAKNWIEAGYTLKMYADKLSWDKQVLTLTPIDSVGQPEWKYKETLYHKIIKLFTKGKYWEKAIPMCKELIEFYELKRVDYKTVIEMLKTQQFLYERILTETRYEPEYFCVSFIGMGFLHFLRNKTFVYRGLEFERRCTFKDRLQVEFPQAEILSEDLSSSNEQLRTSTQQFIHIKIVKPIPNLSCLRSSNVPIPDEVAKFYMLNDIRLFTHDKHVLKEPIDEKNEIKNLWVERTTFEIANHLPGILKCFEVTTSSVNEISPIILACEMVEKINNDLLQLIRQFTLDSKRPINPFTVLLQSVLDENLQGEISKYPEAFFGSNEFKKDSKETESDIKYVYKLKSLIVKQSEIVKDALELYAKIIPPTILPLHRLLMDKFDDLFKQKISSYNAFKRRFSENIVSKPLPLVPNKRWVSAADIDISHEENPYLDMSRNTSKECEYLQLTNIDEGEEVFVENIHPVPLPRKIDLPKRPMDDEIYGDNFEEFDDDQSDDTYIEVNKVIGIDGIDDKPPPIPPRIGSWMFATKSFSSDNDNEDGKDELMDKRTTSDTDDKDDSD